MATLTAGSNRIQRFSSGRIARNRQIGLAGHTSLATLVGGRPGIAPRTISGWLPPLGRLHRLTIQRSINFIFARRRRRHEPAETRDLNDGAFDSQEPSFFEDGSADLPTSEMLQPATTRILRRTRPLAIQRSLLQMRRTETAPQEFTSGMASPSDLFSPSDTTGPASRGILESTNRSLLPFVFRSWIRRERTGARENAALESRIVASAFAERPAALQNYPEIYAEPASPGAARAPGVEIGGTLSSTTPAALYRKMYDEPGVLPGLPSMLPNTAAASYTLAGQLAERAMPLTLQAAVQRHALTPAMVLRRIALPASAAEQTARILGLPGVENVQRNLTERAVLGDLPQILPRTTVNSLRLMSGVATRVAPLSLSLAVQRELVTPVSAATMAAGLPSAALQREFYTPAPQDLVLRRRPRRSTQPADGSDVSFTRAGMQQFGTTAQASRTLQTPIAPIDRPLTGWGWSPLMSALVGADHPARTGRSETRQTRLQRQAAVEPASAARYESISGSILGTQTDIPSEAQVAAPLAATGFAQIQAQPLANTVLQRLAQPFTNTVLRQLSYPLTAEQERAGAFAAPMFEDTPLRYTRTQTMNRSLLPFVLRLWHKPERAASQAGIEPGFTDQTGTPRQPMDARISTQPGVAPTLAGRAQRSVTEMPRSLTERAMLGDMPLVVPQAATGSLYMMDQIATRVAPLQLRTTVQRTLHAATPLMMLQRRINRMLAETAPEIAETQGASSAQIESPSLRRIPDAATGRATGESALAMPAATPPSIERTLERSRTGTESINPLPAAAPLAQRRGLPTTAGESATGTPATPATDRVLTGWGWSPLLSALLGDVEEAPAIQRAGLRTNAEMVRQPGMGSFALSQEYMQFEPVQRVLAQRAFRRPGATPGELADSSFAQLQAQPAIGTALTGYHTPATERAEQAVLGDLPGVVPQAAATSLLFMNRIAERVAPAEVKTTVQRLLNLPAQAMVLQRMLHLTEGEPARNVTPGLPETLLSQTEQGVPGETRTATPTIGAAGLQRSSERQADTRAMQPPLGSDRILGGWGRSPVLSMLLNMQAGPAGSRNLLSRMSWGQDTWSNFDRANRTFATVWRRLFMQQPTDDTTPMSDTQVSPVQRWFAAPQSSRQMQQSATASSISGNRAFSMQRESGDIWGMPSMTLATAMLRRHIASNYDARGIPADFAGQPSGTPAFTQPSEQLQLWSAEPPVGSKIQQPIASRKISGDIVHRMLRREWGGSWDMPAMTMATAMLRRHIDSSYVEENVPAELAAPPSGKPASAELTATNEPLRSVEPFQHVDQANEARQPSFDRPEQIVAYARAGRLPGAGPTPSWSPSPVVQRSGWSGTPGLDFETTGAGKTQEHEAQAVEADIRRMMYGEPASVGITYGKAAASTVRRAMAPTPGRESVQRDESRSIGGSQAQTGNMVQLVRSDDSSSTAEPDLDTLARQVYSAVKDRLAIERERMNTNSGWLR